MSDQFAFKALKDAWTRFNRPMAITPAAVAGAAVACLAAVPIARWLHDVVEEGYFHPEGQLGHPRQHAPSPGSEGRLREAARHASQAPCLSDAIRADVIVIGGSSAGLGAAVELASRGVHNYIVVEGGPAPGGPWATRYERLHLHTPRVMSSPRADGLGPQYPTFVSAADLCRYYRSLALRLRVRCGVRVDSVQWDADRGRWAVVLRRRVRGLRVGGMGPVAPPPTAPDPQHERLLRAEVEQGDALLQSFELVQQARPWNDLVPPAAIEAAGGNAGDPEQVHTVYPKSIVLATGRIVNAVVPPFPGLSSFNGPVLHSPSHFRTGAPLRGRHVLVVGMGNSAAEAALDAWEHAAASVTVVCRSPINILPRRSFWRTFQFKAVVSMLPVWLLDLGWQLQYRISYPGGLDRWGLHLQSEGSMTQRLLERPSVLDLGTIDLVKSGAVRVVRAGIDRVEPGGVVCTDGTRVPCDVMLLGTGFEMTKAPYADLLEPAAAAAAASPSAHANSGRELGYGRGLYLTGLNPGLAHLITFRDEAVAIARDIIAKRYAAVR